MDRERDVDVVVVGGGLSGLAAAAYLARAGQRVVVLEKAQALGGRAATRTRQGFSFNFGAHALYRGGAGMRVLKELGVAFGGATPSTSGNFAFDGGKLHTLPTGLLSLLTTGLLPLAGKLELARWMGSVLLVDTAAIMGISASEWLNRNVRAPKVQEILGALFRLSSYTADLTTLSAGVAISQLIAALKHNVLYLDGGWQSLVDGLREAASAAGVSILTSSRATGIDMEGGAVRGVALASGQHIACSAAVIASSPDVARSLAADSPSISRWAEQARPVEAACLDVALSELPRPHALFALGIDRPLYLSVHSVYAALAPKGGAVIHAIKYLGGEASEGPEAHPPAEAELEGLLDQLQPGWRDRIVERRFLPSMVVYHDIAAASSGGFAGRPGPAVPEVEGLFVAGDWVGPEGLLADASLASAKSAAQRIAGRKHGKEKQAA